MFNPSEHLMQLSGKDYLEVKFRLVWFREQCPQGTIDTEELAVDLDRETEEEISVWNNETRKKEKVTKRANGYARYRAIVTDGKGGRATATKSEKAASFPDFCEKAETGAVGRALAMLGYGTQFTGDELAEGDRIVDSPVPRAPKPDKPLVNGDGSPATVAITRGDLYTLGEHHGLWSRTSPEKFYMKASEISGRQQSKVNWDMTLDEMGQMHRWIAEPASAETRGK